MFIIPICLVFICVFCSQKSQNNAQAESDIKNADQADSILVRRMRFDGYRHIINDDLRAFIPDLKAIGMQSCEYCHSDSSGAHNLFVFTALNKSFNTDMFARLYEMEELFVQPEGAYISNFLKLQIWHFYDESSTKEVMEMLKTLKTRPIYYTPSINWIFVQYKKRIFFVSSFSYKSDGFYFEQIKDIILKKASNPTDYLIFRI